VPLLWASYPEWELYKSLNTLAEALPLSLLTPAGVELLRLLERFAGRPALWRGHSKGGFYFKWGVPPGTDLTAFYVALDYAEEQGFPRPRVEVKPTRRAGRYDRPRGRQVRPD
jgi:hypothetical protein